MIPRKISVSEPVYALKRIPIRENGEPFEDYSNLSPQLILSKPVYDYSRATLVRRSVFEKLREAIDALPKSYRLGIIEGWRPGYIQRRMWLTSWLRFKKLHPDWSDHQVKRIVNRFVAPPDAAVPPPHSTGGAVDIQLYDGNGKLLDLSSPYEMFDPRSYPVDAKGLSDEATKNRTILRDAMLASGMTNYPSEWWHWSFGDQGWAYRGGHAHAIYGKVESPEGWSPNPEDANEEPLVRLSTSDPASGFPKLR